MSFGGLGLGKLGAGAQSNPPKQVVDPAAAAYFARLTPAPSAQYQSYYNSLFKALRAAGLLGVLDGLWVMATGQAQWAQQNLIQNSFNLTPVNAPAFTVNQGYASNGTSSYLGTGFVPSTAGGHFALNSASLGVWTLDTVASSGVPIGARTTSSTNQSMLVPGTSSGQFRVNQNTTSALTSSAIGFIAGARSASNLVTGYNAGASIGTVADVSTALTTLEIYLGALNNAGTASNFAAVRLAVGFLGDGLTATAEGMFYSALRNFLTSVGAI